MNCAIEHKYLQMIGLKLTKSSHPLEVMGRGSETYTTWTLSAQELFYLSKSDVCRRQILPYKDIKTVPHWKN